jgi:uncharacterized protein YecT (DUF1311 family)
MVSAPRALSQSARADDRALITACIATVFETATRAAAKASDEPRGVAGRLAQAARDSQGDPRSCIGAIVIPCQQEPDGQSTAGMIECGGRELAVWDELLNASYRKVLAAASPAVATALRQAQRAWIAWRDLRCKLPAVEHEGGSIVGPLTIDCLRTVTAEQAIWLRYQE